MRDSFIDCWPLLLAGVILLSLLVAIPKMAEHFATQRIQSVTTIPGY